MGSELKVGDLAMIKTGLNFGIVVTLVSFHTSGRVFLKSGCYSNVCEPEWRCEGAGLVARIGKKIMPVKDGLIAPRHLMPLRGDFQPKQQMTREAAPCA